MTIYFLTRSSISIMYVQLLIIGVGVVGVGVGVRGVLFLFSISAQVGPCPTNVQIADTS
jgi:hypothetical protein